MNPGGPDYTYSALNGLTRAPDGTITYDFDGHVHAQGLDLDAAGGIGELAPADRKVRWLSQANGAVVADISASEEAAGFPLKEVALAANYEGHRAELRASASDPSLVSTTALTARAGDDFIAECTIVDDRGHSSFLRPGGLSPDLNVVLGGFVASNGTTASGDASSFLSSRTGVGLYTITFLRPFAEIPAFSVLVAQAGIFGARATALAADHVSIVTFNNAFAAADAQFVFLAYGRT